MKESAKGRFFEKNYTYKRRRKKKEKWTSGPLYKIQNPSSKTLFKKWTVKKKSRKNIFRQQEMSTKSGKLISMPGIDPKSH